MFLLMQSGCISLKAGQGHNPVSGKAIPRYVIVLLAEIQHLHWLDECQRQLQVGARGWEWWGTGAAFPALDGLLGCAGCAPIWHKLPQKFLQ